VQFNVAIDYELRSVRGCQAKFAHIGLLPIR
jgi:hypothetical protein